MSSYAKQITNVPQTKPLVGHKMVKNNAGGYVFEITPQERLERFLLIGSEGGTYYAGEQELTIDNAKSIIEYIKNDNAAVISTLLKFSEGRRVPKRKTLVFVLSLCIRFGDAKLAYPVIPIICTTGTDLFMLIDLVKTLGKGWSRGLRSAIAKWYQKNKNLAYQLVKYRNRNGYTHRDVLRLSHAKPLTDEMAKLFGWAAEKVDAKKTGNELIMAYDRLLRGEGDLVETIVANKMTWEMIPNEHLNDKLVLKALLENMPYTALLRNLNRFAWNKIDHKLIVPKVKKADAHPVNIINSMFTYQSGRGEKSDKTWEPNQNVVDALQDAYEIALKSLKQTEKAILLAVDVSVSMSAKANGTNIRSDTLGMIMATTMLKTAPNADLILFDTAEVKHKIGRRTSLTEIMDFRANGGGTDCSVAFTKESKYDAIIIFTDNETWAGEKHGITRLEEYRKKFNKDVKVIEVAFTATNYSTLPDDKNLLRIAGFDGNIVNVISNFIE